MRNATIRLTPPPEGIHPVDRVISAHPDVESASIDHITGLDDGTAVVLSQFRGDPEVIETVLDDAEDIVDYHLTVADGAVYVHVHFEPNETARALLDLRRSHELVVRTPIHWRSDDRIEISAVGDDRTLQEAVAGLPDDFGVELVEIGEYDPETERPEALLTDRQLEVLDAALEVGYYEEPRQGTQADVAEVVGLAPATVGEHLRRIEGKVLRSLRE